MHKAVWIQPFMVSNDSGWRVVHSESWKRLFEAIEKHLRPLVTTFWFLSLKTACFSFLKMQPECVPKLSFLQMFASLPNLQKLTIEVSAAKTAGQRIVANPSFPLIFAHGMITRE